MSKLMLIIGYVWPEPGSSAAGSRMMQLIHVFLGQGWRIVFASAALLSEKRADLTALGVEEKCIALNCQSFNRYVADLKPDLVMFDRFFTEEQFGVRVEQSWSQALRLLNTEDLHCLRSVREKIVKAAKASTSTEAEKYGLNLTANDSAQAVEWLRTDDMALREIAAIFRCDLTLIISRREMQLLQEDFDVPSELLFYCPFLPDQASAMEITASTPDFSQRKGFMTIGNFRHPPNWDAVLCLKHVIWPSIRAHLPQAELNIYGAYLPPKASALHDPRSGFLIRGWTEDAAAAMQRARVCLAPLRFGAGLKGKLWEVMREGTPSVTTPLGAEAMHGSLPWGGAIAETNAAFVSAAVALHENEALWQEARLRGAAVFAQFSGEEAPALLERINQLMIDLPLHRRGNFIGQMLRHHLHKSTQYMSRWIEVKNLLLTQASGNDK